MVSFFAAEVNDSLILKRGVRLAVASGLDAFGGARHHREEADAWQLEENISPIN